MPITVDELFAGPASKPAGGGMTVEEVFGKPPAEDAKGFVENFKAHSKATSLSGGWQLFADEGIQTNIFKYLKNNKELARKVERERGELNSAKQILADPAAFPPEQFARAQAIKKAADEKAARDSVLAAVPGAVESLQGMVKDALENPGKLTAEMWDGLVRDPWQLFLGGFGGKVVAGKVGQAVGSRTGAAAGGAVGAGTANAMGGAAISAAEDLAKEGEVSGGKAVTNALAGFAMGAPFGAAIGAATNPARGLANAKGRAEQARAAAKNDSILDAAERFANARPPAEPPSFIPPTDLAKMSKKDRATYEKDRAAFEGRMAADIEANAPETAARLDEAQASRLEGFYDEAQDAIPLEPRAAPPEYNAPSIPDRDLPIGGLAGRVPKGELIDPPIIGVEPAAPLPADPHITLFESARDKVLGGKAFDLTAAEKVALKGHVDTITRGGKIQRGKADPRLLAALAAGGLGAAIFGPEMLDESGRDYIAAALAGSMGLVGKGKPFYLAGPEALGKISRKAGTPTEWAKELDAAQGKVGKGAKEEWEAMGGPEWLEGRGGKVGRGEIEDFLKRGVSVEEKVLSSEPGKRELVAQEMYGEAFNMLSRARQAEVIAEVEAGGISVPTGSMDPPQFDSPNLRLPGGENYREHLFRLPEGHSPEWAVDNNFRSSHHPDANIVAHTRTTDRVAADGSPGMFLEEVQSDWGQKLRSDPTVPKGPFVGSTEAWTSLALRRMISKAVDEGKDWVGWTTGKQQNERYNLRTVVDRLEYSAGNQKLNGFKDGVEIVSHTVAPDELANYVGKEIAEKLLHEQVNPEVSGALEKAKAEFEAVKGEYEAIRNKFYEADNAWRLAYNAKSPALEAAARKKEAISAESAQVLRRRNAAELKIWDLQSKVSSSSVQGPDLEVGQKDLRPYYDTIVPKVAEKIAKKLGGRVGEIEIGTPRRVEYTLQLPEGGYVEHPVTQEPYIDTFSSRASADDYARNVLSIDNYKVVEHRSGTAEKQPALFLTPEMKEKVREGMPLFGRQGGFAKQDVLNAMALGTAGAAIGAWLGGKDKKEWGAAVGGLLGVAAAMGALRKPGAAVNWGLGLVSREFHQIDPRLRRVMTHFEVESLVQNLRNKVAITPFVDAFRKLDKPAQQEVTLALYNGERGARDLVASKYPSIAAGLDEVDRLVGEKSAALKGESRFKGGPEYYFHRAVKDLDGLMEALGKENAAGLAARLAEVESKVMKAAGRMATPEERAAAISDWMRETKAGLSHRAGYTKRRGQDVTPDLLPFYHDAPTSLMAFLAEAEKDIQKTKLFGKKAATKSQGGVKYLNVEDSISNVVNEQLAAGNVTIDQAGKLRELLRSRLGPGEKSMPTWHQDIQNVVSASLLGHLTNAVKQVPDYAMGMLMVGARPMLQATFDGLRGKSKMSLHDLGLVNHVFDEFAQDRLSARYLNWVLNRSGFSHIDVGSRHVIVNAALSKFARDAVRGGKELSQKYGREFSVEELEALKADLIAGDKTPLVRDLVFMELSDIQPVSRLERSQAYLDHPDARFMFHLKSYTMKQLDISRKQVIDNWNDGAKGEAMRKALGLAVVWGGVGAATETLVDWMLGKTSKFSDKVFDQIARNLGWSDWAAGELRGKPGEKGNAAKAMGLMFAPPGAGLAYDVASDPQKAIRAIPLIGRWLYAYGMGGALEDQERELIKNGGIADVKKDRAERKESGTETRRDLERQRLKKQKVESQAEEAERRGNLEQAEKLRGRLEKMQYKPDAHWKAYQDSMPVPKGVDGPPPGRAPQTLDEGWRVPSGVRVPPPVRPLPQADRSRRTPKVI